MLETILVIAIIVLVLCLLALVVLSSYSSIVASLYKINVVEQRIEETFKTKEDLMSRAINIIERQLKLEIKAFEEFKKINSSKLSNVDKDIVLTATFNEIKRITEDYSELAKVKSYNGIIRDIEECNTLLGGMKNMNNKYVAIYNNDIKRFPKNIISKFKKFKIKYLYENSNKTNDII